MPLKYFHWCNKHLLLQSHYKQKFKVQITYAKICSFATNKASLEYWKAFSEVVVQLLLSAVYLHTEHRHLGGNNDVTVQINSRDFSVGDTAGRKNHGAGRCLGKFSLLGNVRHLSVP